jgi:polygalacturonase
VYYRVSRQATPPSAVTELKADFRRKRGRHFSAHRPNQVRHRIQRAFKNITVSNCVFEFCRGLALKTVDGQLREDVTIRNITMRKIVNAPSSCCGSPKLRSAVISTASTKPRLKAV